MNKENFNDIYYQFTSTPHKAQVIITDKGYGKFKDSVIRFLDTSEGHIIASATLSAIRDFLKFHLNGKIEKANTEIIYNDDFIKSEYYLGVKDTATEILNIIERMEI